MPAERQSPFTQTETAKAQGTPYNRHADTLSLKQRNERKRPCTKIVAQNQKHTEK
jgi:hypothetical protein